MSVLWADQSSLHLRTERLQPTTSMSGLFLVLVLTSWTITSCYDIPEVNLMAKSGDNVTLNCDTVSGNIIQLAWRRPDLAEDEYVFFYRNNRVQVNHMDPRFRGRVTLKDPKTSSIVLESVTVSDSGTYKCRVKVEENRRKKRSAGGPPDRVVKLTVTDGHHGEDGGIRSHGGGIAAVVAGVAVIVAVVGVVVFHRKRQSRDEHRLQSDLLN